MTRGRLATVTLIVVAALSGAACSTSERSSTAVEGGFGSGPEVGSTSAPPVATPNPGFGNPQVNVLADVPQIGPSIVRTAQLSIQVPKGQFTAAFNRASSVAGANGGFVESTTTMGSKLKSGSLTIRVPVAKFDDALRALRAIGAVQSQNINGKDVTAQFVDLDARLRNARAEENVLLRLLSKAPTVASSLQVQSTLSNVELQIEELTGERRALANQAAFSTITVGLFEGTPIKHVKQPVTSGVIREPQLSEAWHRAKAVFFGLLYGLVVALAVILPLGLIALVGLLAFRRRRATTP